MKFLKYINIFFIPIISHKIYSKYNPAVKKYNAKTLKYETIHTDCLFGPKNYELAKINKFIMKINYVSNYIMYVKK